MSPRRYSWKRPLNKKKRPKEDTEGESFNQPNNHSKLTDSNNCILFIILISILLLFSLLPSAPCPLPVALPQAPDVCVPRHVKHVLDVSARGLLIKDFCDDSTASSYAHAVILRLCCATKRPKALVFRSLNFIVSIGYRVYFMECRISIPRVSQLIPVNSGTNATAPSECFSSL